jgi:hypothetical protein
MVSPRFSSPAVGLTLTLTLTLLLLAACGDARLGKLSAGIPKDSAIAVMGRRPDLLKPYLVDGKYIEAMFFAKPGADSGTTPERKLEPVIAVDGKVQAWGWDEWEKLAAQYRIVLPAK